MTTTNATNRALTLAGANKIFEVIGLEIKQHPELNYYYCDYRGCRWQKPTLTALCQDLVVFHMEHNT